ncbi:MlaD family protein [Robertkochia solimangrovi]|uniref:MlaD family protein n=1 Tax=Robertkochia solimangrovi TaxID=2213046 RepID=UPI00117F226E|nr:MlaD family protein [Robertkochia solimangrovi]TRZ40985.1 MCE family protein [Robertkochia solimangrovi]
MAKSISEKIWLGVLVVLGTIFLVVAAYLIGSQQNLFSKSFSISARFNNVNGLQPGNNVRFSGIDVGTVKSLIIENDSTIAVVMMINLDVKEHIKRDAIATIGSDGLVGNMVVNILPGKDSLVPVSDGDFIQSYSRIGTDDMLNTLNMTNENAALLTSNLLKVSQSLVQGKGTLGRLLNDTLLANDLQKTIANLKIATANLNISIAKFNQIIDTISIENSVAGVLLTDTLAANKMKRVIDNLESSSGVLDSTLTSIDMLVRNIEQGEGAVNYLTTDTLLVKQLEATIDHIEEGTDRFNQNMEALKHNFLFRKYFKKLEKEEEKRKALEENN